MVRVPDASQSTKWCDAEPGPTVKRMDPVASGERDAALTPLPVLAGPRR